MTRKVYKGSCDDVLKGETHNLKSAKSNMSTSPANGYRNYGMTIHQTIL